MDSPDKSKKKVQRRRSSRGRRSSISVAASNSSPTVVHMPLSESVLGNTPSEKIQSLLARKAFLQGYIQDLEQEQDVYESHLKKHQCTDERDSEEKLRRPAMRKSLEGSGAPLSLRPQYLLHGVMKMFNEKNVGLEKQKVVDSLKEKLANAKKSMQVQKEYDVKIVKLLLRDSKDYKKEQNQWHDIQRKMQNRLIDIEKEEQMDAAIWTARMELQATY